MKNKNFTIYERHVGADPCVRPASNEQRNGFTLVEVLVSLAIAALALTAISQLSLNAAKLSYQTAQEFNALPIAIEEMEEVKGKNLLLDSSKEVQDYTVKSKIENETFEDFDYRKLTLDVIYKNEPQIQLYWFDIDLAQVKAEKNKNEK